MLCTLNVKVAVGKKQQQPLTTFSLPQGILLLQLKNVHLKMWSDEKDSAKFSIID